MEQRRRFENDSKIDSHMHRPCNLTNPLDPSGFHLIPKHIVRHEFYAIVDSSGPFPLLLRRSEDATSSVYSGFREDGTILKRWFI